MSATADKPASPGKRRYDLYLSYSGRLAYTLCPKQYHYKYVLKEPGAHKDGRDTFFGSAIGKVFEWFYERRVWSSPDVLSATLSLIDESIRTVASEDGFDPSCDPVFLSQLRSDLGKFVPAGLETVRTHRLLSVDSRAEYDFSQYHRDPESGLVLKLGGRSDFVHRHDPGPWILDGKASKHRDKYTDSEQVIWYALLHYLKHGVAPSRVGFIYWRFPEDPVQWVDYGAQSLRSSLKRTLTVAKGILAKDFEPSVSPACSMCSFNQKCGPGARYVAERKVASGGRIESSIFDLDQV